MLEYVYEELEGSKDVLRILLLEIIRKNRNNIKEVDNRIEISTKYIPTEIERTLIRTGYLLKRPIPGTDLEMRIDMNDIYIYS